MKTLLFLSLLGIAGCSTLSRAAEWALTPDPETGRPPVSEDLEETFGEKWGETIGIVLGTAVLGGGGIALGGRRKV